MKHVITSFTIFSTAEGESVSFTFTSIDDDGNKVVENERRSLVLVGEEQLKLANELKKFLLTKVGD